MVDKEIRRIIDEQYAIARKIIEDNRDKVEAMAKALLEWETIDSQQIDDIMEGRPPRAPEDTSSHGGSNTTGSASTDEEKKQGPEPKMDSPAGEH
jgi:cell division protease FtsH